MLRRHLIAPLLLLSVMAVPVMQDPTVYKTRTGDKYHRDGCRYLRKSKIAIKLSEAKRDGLIACKVCKP